MQNENDVGITPIKPANHRNIAIPGVSTVELIVEQDLPLHTQCDRATQLMFPINICIVQRCTGCVCPTALNHINVEVIVEQVHVPHKCIHIV